MTDRELLKAAARAAGMSEMLAWTPGAIPWLRVNPDLSRPWNPLTDDGDALRLAVKLRIDLALGGKFVFAWSEADEDFLGEHGEDRAAAARRAIVRAAAAMAPTAVGAA